MGLLRVWVKSNVPTTYLGKKERMLVKMTGSLEMQVLGLVQASVVYGPFGRGMGRLANFPRETGEKHSLAPNRLPGSVWPLRLCNLESGSIASCFQHVLASILAGMSHARNLVP